MAKVASKNNIGKKIVKLRTAGITMDSTMSQMITPLVWYKTAEQTRFVLYNAIATYAELLMAEKEKVHPDDNQLRNLTQSINRIRRITRDPRNFQSIDRMKKLTQQYTTVNGA